MKKKLIVLFFSFFALPLSIKADNIYNISMDVIIDKFGNANIKEVWDVKASSGSEWYKQILNLGNSELTNFKVSMDNVPLTYKDWDIDESMYEKSGYYGINNISNGLELCFGKSDTKRHTFTLNYDISNFVINTSDSQALYWNLFPEFTADNFSVKVSSYYSFPDTLDVWGYGYKGYAYVKDGIIEMSNEGSLNSEYVTLLVKFPLNTFETTNTIKKYKVFDDVLNIAEKGTFEYDYNIPTIFEKILNWLYNMLGAIALVLFSFFAGKAMRDSKYGYINNKVIDKNETPMFREIPCNKDIYYANALYKINNFSGYKETNILGSIILKWLKNNKIIYKNEKKGVFNKDTSILDLTLNPTFDNETEKELFDMMYKASKDGYLENKELEKWCRNNYSKFLALFAKINSSYVDKLKTENHIYIRTSKEECKYKNVMDDTLYEESKKLYGLKKFLIEFSDINSKEAIEVHLWDEYLMFAYIFGIADKVAKQLKHMYPEVLEQENFDYDTLIFINHLSYNSVSAASSARQAAQSYTSGGGGFSSGGGGGGSFGGGGSMGGR